jgi:hypothetical protein
MRGRDRARQASRKEPAEGSRDTVARTESRARGAGAATGITNAPRERERASQAALPPRGGRKGEGARKARARPGRRRA